jgi:hypothetical protein
MKKIIVLVMLFGWLIIGGATAFATMPNLSDVSTARSFLLELPPACGKSYMTTLPDGTIMIQVICDGTDQGRIYIKDGIVKRID